MPFTRFNLRGVWIAGLLAVFGCLGPLPPRPGVPPPGEPVPPPPVQEPVLPGEEIPPMEGPRIGVLWVPGPRVDPLASAQYLAARPSWRITAVLSDRFFGQDDRAKQAKTLFQALVSSKQVEVVLTVPNRPVMALVMDTDQAQESVPPVTSLPSRFSWPDDVTEQIDLARAAHRRRWRVSPVGLELPWDAVLGPEIAALSRFKIEWAVLPATATPQLIEGFRIPLLRPALVPIAPAVRKAWAKSTLEPVVKSSGVYGPIQVGALEDLAALEGFAGVGGRAVWVPVSRLMSDDTPPACLAPTSASPPDFTPWIGEPEENRAWELLGIARRAVENYQNSGGANLRALDLAKREIHGAESGAVFFALGAEGDAARDDDVRREFIATLAQVYQIMGQPVPPEIRQGFSRSPLPVNGVPEPDGTFERDGTILRWRDAVSDDRGPGDYFYPTGSYPAGSWDLRSFEVRPTEDAVLFRYELTALSNPGRAPGGFSLSLVDTYIDINRSPGAGSQDLLAGRPGLVEATDAWEYALSVDGWGGRFYQFVPGQPPRLLGTFAVTRDGPGAFVVSVPVRILRGSPESWGFGVAVFGLGADGRPLPVAVDPGPDRFGGAVADRIAPPFIDVLTPPGVSQRRTLGIYKSGQDITLPFVRPE